MGRTFIGRNRVRRDGDGTNGDQEGRPNPGHPQTDRIRNFVGQIPVNPLWGLLSKLDLTEAFKTKGDLKRWSAKRTIGGVVVLTACNDIVTHGMSWPGVVMCAVGITPLCLSFMED